MNCDIERGGRLVGDQKLGLAGERNRDHDALAHASAELMGKFVDDAGRFREADAFEEGNGFVQGLAAVHVEVLQQDLNDLVADREHRMEGAHGLLEDHGDLAAADGADLTAVGGEGCDVNRGVVGMQADCAAVDPAGRHGYQLEEGERGHALAAA